MASGEKRLLEALLKTYRHLETRIGESKAFVEKLYEESRVAQFIRTIPGFGKYLSVLVAVEIADLIYKKLLLGCAGRVGLSVPVCPFNHREGV